MSQTVAFFTFEQFHNKQAVGSTALRVHQLIRHWPEASLYKYGAHPDVLVFQKVYVTPDYTFPEHYPGIKILDICDADWTEGALIKQTVDAMHAVTCPTEALAKFLRQLTDKPVVVIPDRFDLALIPGRKPHINEAKRVLWFGYRHNAITLKPAMDIIDQLGLHLTIIADDDPMPWQWLLRDRAEAFRNDRRYKFIKYKEETIYDDMQQCDFAIFPEGGRPQDRFKSNNKTIKAILAGLPVAKTKEEIESFIQPEAREKYMEKEYNRTKKDYDCSESVRQYKDLIATLKA